MDVNTQDAADQVVRSSSILSTLFQSTWPQLLAGAFVAYLAFLVPRVIYSLNFHPLASYPGPWLARSGLPLSWNLIPGLRGRSLFALDDAHKKYGTWIRIGYNELSTLDGKAVPVLYSASTKWKKTEYYQAFRPPPGPQNVFSTLHSHEHSYYRKLASNSFAMSSLLTMQPRVHRQGLALCDLLERKYAKTGEPADMAWYLLCLAADVVGSLGFGHPDGFSLLKNEVQESEILTGAARNNDLSHIIGVHRNLGHRVWTFLGNFVTASPALQSVVKFAEKNVGERRKCPPPSLHDPTAATDKAVRLEDEVDRDMISWWLRTKDPQTGDVLTNQLIVDNAMLLLVAGSDTTATTMRALLMYVTTTPGVKEKLTAEIDEAIVAGALSWPPLYEEAIQLEYMQACLKEALRMWPAVGYVLSRTPPAEGATIGDRYIPAGVAVGIPAPHYHRVAEHAFGPEPEKFKPERWIGGTDKERRLREANMLSFGSGTRICIGKNIALLEISVVAPMLFRKFDFQVVPRKAADGPADQFGEGGEAQNWKVFSTWFAVQSDMKMKLTLRSHDEE